MTAMTYNEARKQWHAALQESIEWGKLHEAVRFSKQPELIKLTETARLRLAERRKRVQILSDRMENTAHEEGVAGY